MNNLNLILLVNILNFIYQNNIDIRQNEQKQVKLHFQIKVPGNIIHQLISNTLLQKRQVEIYSGLLTRNNKYKEFILKIINKSNCFPFKFPKNTEIARLYFFTEAD